MWWYRLTNRVHDALQQPWAGQMLFGALLVLMGILILLVPQILIALIAGGFVFAGIVSIASAWHTRRVSQDWSAFWHRFPF